MLWKDLKDVEDTYNDFNEYINLIMILNPGFLKKKKKKMLILSLNSLLNDVFKIKS